MPARIARRKKGGVLVEDKRNPQLVTQQSDERRYQTGRRDTRDIILQQQKAARETQAEGNRALREAQESKQTFATSTAANASVSAIVAKAVEGGQRITPEFVRSIRSSLGAGGEAPPSTGRSLRPSAEQTSKQQDFLRQSQQSYEAGVKKSQEPAQVRTGVRQIPISTYAAYASPADVEEISRRLGVTTIAADRRFNTIAQNQALKELITKNQQGSAGQVQQNIQSDIRAKQNKLVDDLVSLQSPKTLAMMQSDPEFRANMMKNLVKEAQLINKAGDTGVVTGVAGSTRRAIGDQGIGIQADQGFARRAEDIQAQQLQNSLSGVSSTDVGPGVLHSVLGNGYTAPAAPVPSVAPVAAPAAPVPSVAPVAAPVASPPATQTSNMGAGYYAPPVTPITAPSPPAQFTSPGGATPSGLSDIGGTPNLRALRFQYTPRSQEFTFPGGATPPGLSETGGIPPALRALRFQYTPRGPEGGVGQPGQVGQPGADTSPPTQDAVSALLARLRYANPGGSPEAIAAQAIQMGAPQTLVAADTSERALRSSQPLPFAQAYAETQAKFQPTQQVAPTGGFQIPVSEDILLNRRRQEAEIKAIESTISDPTVTGPRDIAAEDITIRNAQGNIDNLANIVAVETPNIGGRAAFQGDAAEITRKLAENVARQLAGISDSAQLAGVKAAFLRPDNPTIALLNKLIVEVSASGAIGPGKDAQSLMLTQIRDMLQGRAGFAVPPSLGKAGGGVGTTLLDFLGALGGTGFGAMRETQRGFR